MKTTYAQISRGLVFVAIAGSMMGNESCQQEAATTRQLRRRVQMGSVQAVTPNFQLPSEAGGGSFNFEFAANAQLQKVLRNTQTFSSIGSFIDPASMSTADKAEFYNCSASDTTKAFEFSPEAACMVDQPLGLVNVIVTDFRFQTGANIDLGFGQLGALKGLAFSFDKAKLSLDLQANNPMLRGQDARGQVLAAVEGASYFKSYGGKVSLDFGVISTGLGGYYRSDMAKVVEDGLQDGLVALKKDWDANAPDRVQGGWYAMIVKNCDVGVLINAGNKADAGLVKDDIVALYNVDYQWSGQACHSQLKFAIEQEQPIAYAKIVTTADSVSRAVVIENDPNYPHRDGRIVPGARVYAQKLVQPATTATK